MSCFYLIMLWYLSYESMKWLWDTMVQSSFLGCLHEDFRVLGIRGVASWWQIFGRQPQAGFVEGLAAMRWLKVMEGSLIHSHHWFIVMEELTSSLKTRDSNPNLHVIDIQIMSTFKKKHNKGYWGVIVPGVLLFLHLFIKTKELCSWSYFLIHHGDANMGFSKRQRVVDSIALLQHNFITIPLKKQKAQRFHMSNTVWCMFSRTCRNLFHMLSCNSNLSWGKTPRCSKQPIVDQPDHG